MAPAFESILDLPQRVKTIVEVNNVGIAFWPPRTAVKYLATGYLNACTGIAIISPEAGILAHIAPVPPGSTAEPLVRNLNMALENAQNLLRHVAQLYHTHRAIFSSTQTFVVAGIFSNSLAMEQVVRLINAFLANVRLEVKWKSYNVMSAGALRPVGHSSVIMHGCYYSRRDAYRLFGWCSGQLSLGRDRLITNYVWDTGKMMRTIDSLINPVTADRSKECLRH